MTRFCAPFRRSHAQLHWATGPGLSGCDNCTQKFYEPPLVFDLEVDPSEQFPLTYNGSTPTDPTIVALLAAADASLDEYMAAYTPGELTAENGGLAPDLDEEMVNGTALYGVCCDRQSGNTCDCDGDPY